MPFLVKNLIENQLNLVCVKKTDLASNAYSLMIENDFSQLPIIDDEYRPLGMITYESILRSVKNLNTTMEQIYVRDALTKALTSFNEDDLFDVLDRLQNTNAVVILTSDHEVIGIVTSYDAMEYFRKRTENLMLVEDIETNIKDLILFAYSDEKDQVNVVELNSAIKQINSHSDSNEKTFDQLTLHEYIHLLFYGKTWEKVKDIFNFDKEKLRKTFLNVRNTRNDLAHFRSAITSEQQDELKFCAEWLTGRLTDWEEQKQKALIDELFKKHKEQESKVESPASTLKEIGETAIGIDSVEASSEAIRFENYDSSNSRYSPLIDFLVSQPGKIDSIKLTFENIESIIGGELPKSARSHRAWWANDTVGHPQSISWLEAGWKTSYINMTEKHVTFSRIKEREKAYIDFFSMVLTELKKKANFPVKNVSPDGSSWMVIADIPNKGPKYGLFVFSFTRSNRFRVELYLDLYNQEKTKRVFDAIYKHKDELAEKVGTLTWERLNEKRASRIAIYDEGQILDKKEKLSKLKNWAVETMIRFYENLAEITEQEIIKEISS